MLMPQLGLTNQTSSLFIKMHLRVQTCARAGARFVSSVDAARCELSLFKIHTSAVDI